MFISAKERLAVSRANRQLQPRPGVLQPTPGLQRDLRGHHHQPRPQVVLLPDDRGDVAEPRKNSSSGVSSDAQKKCLRHRRIVRLSERSQIGGRTLRAGSRRTSGWTASRGLNRG